MWLFGVFFTLFSDLRRQSSWSVSETNTVQRNRTYRYLFIVKYYKLYKYIILGNVVEKSVFQSKFYIKIEV